jgi:hypothetical protein
MAELARSHAKGPSDQRPQSGRSVEASPSGMARAQRAQSSPSGMTRAQRAQSSPSRMARAQRAQSSPSRMARAQRAQSSLSRMARAQRAQSSLSADRPREAGPESRRPRRSLLGKAVFIHLAWPVSRAGRSKPPPPGWRKRSERNPPSPPIGLAKRGLKAEGRDEACLEKRSSSNWPGPYHGPAVRSLPLRDGASAASHPPSPPTRPAQRR